MYAFHRNFLAFAAAIMLIILPQTALAQDEAQGGKSWEKFGANLGVFFSSLDSSLSVGAGVGVEIDVEEVLGLESSSSVFRADTLWRFSKNRRHRLDLTWFSFRRSGDRVLSEDITIDDENGNEITIPAGQSVNSYFNLDIYELAYSYSIVQDDRLDLAAGLGLYIMPIDFGIKAAGVIENEGTARFTAPLPVVSLRMDVALAPDWFIRTGGQVFYLEYEEFTGSVVEFRGALEYNPWEHVGIGLGFDTFGIRIEADGEDWPEIDLKGKVNFNYAGIQLYLRYFF